MESTTVNRPQSSQSCRWIVMKFGGTSVSSAALWQSIAEQIAQRVESGYHVMVVVSAIRGVTDALSGPESGPALTLVEARHEALSADTGAASGAAFAAEMQTLRTRFAKPGPMSPSRRARILAAGERLSSFHGERVLAHLGIEAQVVDARDWIKTGSGGGGDEQAWLSARCEPVAQPEQAERLAQSGQVFITQGFVGANAEGTVVLGRGGSDTSAALFGVILGAERVEIWTDVAGMFSANPRLIPSARLLKHLSYREARELSSMGARVLHPACIDPLRQHCVPLVIRQTSRADIAGTLIDSSRGESSAQIKAVVSRFDITVIVLEGMGMWHQVGFLADVFAAFERHGISIDMVSTSETNVTVSLDLIDQLRAAGDLAPVVAELERLCRVQVVTGCASVSLVGAGARTVLYRLGPALELFAHRRVFMVSQAADDVNLTFVVESNDADKLALQLHQTLIPQGSNETDTFGQTWQQLYYRSAPSPDRTAGWWMEERTRLLELAGSHPSAYVYHLPTVRKAANRLAALANVDRILYSLKANNHPQLIETTKDCGLGAECVSMAEVAHCLDLGIAPADILFTPNFAGRAEYEAALESGVRLTIDNLYILEQWGESLVGAELFLRVDPGAGSGHYRIARTAGSQAKFGIPIADIRRAVELTEAHQIKVVGLHAHTGSAVMQVDVWQQTLVALVGIMERFPDVRFLDLGGGLGVPDKPDGQTLDLSMLDSALGRIRASIDRKIEIWLEPGRYLVAEAGVLLVRVNQTKIKGGVRYAGVSTGMNSLLRPALYGAYHEIVNLTRVDQSADMLYNVVGPICETTDVLGLDRLLPECEAGDTLLIANAGAYGAVMASHYNMREPAVELILDPPDDF